MMSFILIAALAGHPPAQLGSFQSAASCENAIREIFMMKIYKDVQNNPDVIKSIDLAMTYQQEYRCVPQGDTRSR
jgi:hypothetical protein